MIRVFADRYLYNVSSLVPPGVDLHLFDPAEGLPDSAAEADALLTRTVIPMNEETLQGFTENLAFIGSGSAGTDHIDSRFLEKSNIVFANAPGCNARSVAEYVTTTLLMWGEDHAIDITGKTIGIVGVGHAGSELVALLHSLDIPTVAYDPPRAERDRGFTSASIGEVLDCDILSFHTPLTRNGAYPTLHWLDNEKLAGRFYDLVINTARGGVIDEKSLLKQLREGSVKDVIIDVWENEPLFNSQLANHAYRKTPHIAGYSRQAKERATWQIVEALCEFFSLPGPPEPDTAAGRAPAPALPATPSLKKTLAHLHPVLEYEAELLKLTELPGHQKAPAFNKLRAEFPLRDEFQYMAIYPSILDAHPILNKLGFRPA